MKAIPIRIKQEFPDVEIINEENITANESKANGSVEIVTSSGFSCRIDEDALDDAELIDALVKLDKEDYTVIPSVITMLLGEESKKRLYEHLRTERGRVPFTALQKEFAEILLALKGKKIIAFAGMIAADEDKLICDFAETYNIYDYRALPVEYAATLACGLGENSRIKLALNNAEYSYETMLLTSAVDYLALLWWAKTEDGTKNVNRPPSIANIIRGVKKSENNDIQSYGSGEEFSAAYRKITQRE